MEASEDEKKKISLLGETIARKVALDIVSHCYDNKALEGMVTAMKSIFDLSDSACVSFIGSFLKEDNGEYLIDLLLECTENLSRNLTGDLIEHCLDRLKVIEKDLILANPEDNKPPSYAVSFVEKMISAFNVKASKKQYRIQRFL